jgi:AcrR family transcriptional regulator
MATASTRTQIEKAAVALFNDQGTAAVSTRDIAKHAGVSSGNLHYHYANKEAIIRSVLETQFRAYDEVWVLPPDRPPKLADVEAMLYKHFQLLWDYRFFYRELLALTQRDPALRERYREIQQQRLSELEKLFKTLAKAGVVKGTRHSQAFRDVLTASWIVSENWVGHLESIGEKVSVANLNEGVRLVTKLLSNNNKM